MITRVKPELPSGFSKPFIPFVECRFKEQNISYMKVIARPVMKLPAWHKIPLYTFNQKDFKYMKDLSLYHAVT